MVLIKHSRRQFLKHSSSLASGLVAAKVLQPSFVMAQSTYPGKNLVLVNLAGGADALTLFPYVQGSLADTIRQRLRPVLNIPQSATLDRISSQTSNPIGFHPGWARLVGDPDAVGASIPGAAYGDARILKTVGFSEDAGRSHDTTSNMYSIGRVARSSADRVGWLARLMDLENWNNLQVYGIGTGSRIDFNTQNTPPIVVSRVSDFRHTSRNFGGGSFPRAGVTGNASTNSSLDSEYARKIASELITDSAQLDALNQLYDRVDDSIPGAVQFMTQASAITLNEEYRSYNMNDRYTNGNAHNYVDRGFNSLSEFQRQCQDCARVLIQASREPTLANRMRTVYLTRGGWDTHSLQRNGIGNNIQDVAGGLAGLVAELKAHSLWNDTVIMLFSEFSRTNFENSADASRSGTDHAYASFHLVLGGSINPGVAGDDPTTNDLLDRNYLVPSNDFRQGLKEVFQWAGIPSQTVAQVFTEQYSLTRPAGIFV